MSMRIAFIGPHGTGKTTLVNGVARMVGTPVITERARLVAREWGLTPATIPAAELLDYQREVVVRQVGAETAYDVAGFVSDRSVIDNMAYFEALYNANRSIQAWQNAKSWYVSLVNQRVRKYDMLIYVPPMFPLVADGERHTDPKFQREIDLLIKALIKEWGLGSRTFTVTTDGPESRLAEIQDALAGWDFKAQD